MTDATLGRPVGVADARLRRRHRAELRFRLLGVAAICVALGMLAVILIAIAGRGYTAFVATEIAIDVTFDAAEIDPENTGDPDVIRRANFQGLARGALRGMFPGVEGRSDRRDLVRLMSVGAPQTVRDALLDNPDWLGTTQTIWVKAAADFDSLNKGQIPRDVPESDRRVNDKQLAWFDQLAADGRVEKRFNATFFASADSREPELAGIRGAIVGSFLTLLVTLALSFPVGVMSAVYLEEFAPKNRWTDFIEVNINNLAAVPSIVFGLLGLAVFLNFFNLPRSAPVVGGIVLALMTLPTIIIAARAALNAVPPSIREGALGMGASPLQTVMHHVLPLAVPGMLTGTIIGAARALGETEPLLMIGMVAFIVDVPQRLTDPATVLPVQIFLWADAPERGFVEKTSAAIMVLLAFLIGMNLLAVLLRNRFDRRW